jgi:hypothetical protein
VHDEATRRGYAFDRSKIGPVRPVQAIPVTSGQIECEWRHLQKKLLGRSPATLSLHGDVTIPSCHPLFRSRPGPVASWERASADA